ncbi:MAG: cupin domain-containing protein [Streptosporangiales bacterium]|nr:cupin domain-containing protein [Streptosporangiales bacterium]
MEPVIVDFNQVHSFELAEGLAARPLFGKDAMINVVECEPNSAAPAHSHPHEQLGFVVRGTMWFTVAGTEYELGPMQGYVVPGGVQHAARFGPEGCLVLDIFQPVREDFRERWEAARP